MAYLDTPQTEADPTYMTNGHDLENFSIENSILSPLKGKDGLASHLRSGRGNSLKTPRARVPFTDRRNMPTVPGRGEFTPLLQSVAKKNLERNGKLNKGPETPAFLKAGYQSADSPALPGAEVSGLYGSELNSSIIPENDATPVPQIESSSGQSTPLAALPKREAPGVLADQGSVMTLREQENIINKIEKENFGLKLKIHFLEESLRKAGPGFNEVALRENTDLKVDKITIQKELARCRKNLTQAERDIEAYKRHLEEVQERAAQKHADQSLRRELDSLKNGLAAKESEIGKFRQKLIEAEKSGQLAQKLEDDIQDLEADLREKDRVVEERDDEIERLKSQDKVDADEFERVCNELDSSRQRVEDLEAQKDVDGQAQEEVKEIREQLEDALQAKQQAEDDLDELRDEMSNKSFTTKGLSRQLEDKANKLQDDLTNLREKHSTLEGRSNEQSREVKRLQEQLQDADQDTEVEVQRLKDKNELLQHDHEANLRKCESLKSQMAQAVKNYETKSEEKELLHSRHDALTAESQTLQKDLFKVQNMVKELEGSLESEKQHAQNNERRLRSEASSEIDRLSEEIDSLHRELEEKESHDSASQDQWESQRRALQSQKEKAEERAGGLQRTIKKLQETEGTLSGREMKLQEALDSEQQRHKSEEAIFERQIQELDHAIEEKQKGLQDLRSGLSHSKEDLRISQRTQSRLEEKIQALEDEIEVLQSSLEEEADKARDEISASEQEIETLKSELSKATEKLSYAQQDQDTEAGQRLRATEEQVQQARSERQTIQDKLAKISLDMRALQASSAETEAERDEIKSQLIQAQDQVDETYKLDQEKLDLRTSKLRLENDISRLREERKGLLEKNAATESRLEDEINRAASEETRLNDELADVRTKLSAASGNRERELNTAKQRIQRLEVRVEELQRTPGQVDDEEAAAELSMVQKDLSQAQRKEAEYLQREADQKEIVRDLKQKVARLERQSHELEVARLTVDSPKSSVGGSARKSEIVELQRQLTDTHQQLREAKSKAKEEIKVLQRKLAEMERLVQTNLDEYEQQGEQLEADISISRQERESLLAKNNTATQTISRLRSRIASLEKDIRTNHQNATADITIAEERKDLHGMLKDAKLTAEDLQVQLTARENQLNASSTREKDLRAQLKCVREEWTTLSQKCDAFCSELDNLQLRYEDAVDNLSRQQRKWEDERKAMASKVRFANTSVSEVHQDQNQNMDLVKKHASELRGLAKQIQWLRAKCTREQSFRNGLVYEKKFLLMQISMFETCNQIDLNLLSEMGITPSSKSSLRLRLGDCLRSKISQQERKRPSLRTVGFAVVASCRMRRLSQEWAGQRKVREALGRKLEGMVEGRKVKRGGGGR